MTAAKLAPEMVTSADARVGFTVTTSQATFLKLVRLAGGRSATKDSWSEVVTKLIERAS